MHVIHCVRRNEGKKVKDKSESAFGAQTPAQYILQQREQKKNCKLRESINIKNMLSMENTQFTRTCKQASRKVQ